MNEAPHEPLSLDRFGPLRVGQAVSEGWFVASIDCASERVRLVLLNERTTERGVLFLQTPQPGTPDGPYGLGSALTYQRGDVAPSRFQRAGQHIGQLLERARATRPLEQALAEWQSASTALSEGWQDVARRRLVDEPEKTLRLRSLVPEDKLPKALCLLPWSRLELNTNGVVGPCCADYHAQRWRPDHPPSIGEAWASQTMAKFRRALASADANDTCSNTCPHLHGGTCDASSVSLRGGTSEQVDAQLTRVEAMMEGSDVVSVGPAAVLFSPTSFCNYDCLMCRCGQTGSLADELGEEFYSDLLTHADSLQSLEVCGGEPLASPRFRAFLTSLPESPLSHASFCMTTNGSYLIPKIVDSLLRLRGCDLIISLNAASEETYARVNRGLALARVRENLDYLITRKDAGALRGSIRYSMVILRANVHEIDDFAELCRHDGVGYRFMLPQLDRNHQSIMLDETLMRQALDGLERVVAHDEPKHGESSWLRLVKGEAQVLRERLASGVQTALSGTPPTATR